MQARLIKGGVFSDERGQIDFVNDFDLTEVKRFYAITHPTTSEIRAWQGHQKETKWFSCIKGRFLVQLIKIDDWVHPSDSLVPERYILEMTEPSVLYVPPGYANGLQAIDSDSKILVFSDYYLKESIEEKVRVDKHKWGGWN